MRALELGKTLNDRRLNRLIHPLRVANNTTNLGYLAVDYLTLATIVAATIYFCQHRAAWGWSWSTSIPVVGLAVFLVGAVQHRLAGLGHEGAHYVLLRHRLANELVSDWLCMFPLFSTTEQYRLIHLGHHDYTNDWDRDPELMNLGSTRRMDQFPMTRGEFVRHFYASILWPPAFLRYLWENFIVTSLGHGEHPYGSQASSASPGRLGPFRLASVLGVVYFALMSASLGLLSHHGTLTQLALAASAFWLVATAVVCALPAHWLFTSPLRHVVSARATSIMRLGYYTLLQTALSALRISTGVEWAGYVWLLWVLPLFTAFPYYMLLRDMYQHANTDQGKLTNSRVVFCDPFSRWAIFVYGQDVHLTHHLYPAVPHYNLHQLHRLLAEHNTEYAEHVVECHGTFSNHSGHLTLLDVMEIPTCEPGGATLVSPRTQGDPPGVLGPRRNPRIDAPQALRGPWPAEAAARTTAEPTLGGGQ